MNDHIIPSDGKVNGAATSFSDKDTFCMPFQIEIEPLPNQIKNHDLIIDGDDGVRDSHGIVRNLLRKHHRSLFFTGLIACVSIFFLFSSSNDLSSSVHAASLPQTSPSSSSSTPSSPFSDLFAATSFHQSGFGGIRNIAHPAGAKMHRHRLLSGESANVIIPVSAVKHAVPSLGADNIINLHGHYVHDEHHSPFASFLYDRPREELEKEQEEYLQKMESIRNKWGAWNFHDHSTEIRPIANFDSTEYKDLPNSKFPKNAWQMDETYCRSLIDEGRKLIHRVREGIFAEYGHATEGLSEEEIGVRNELFKVHITDAAVIQKGKGVAWITKKGFDMLARKLLHAMITNDEFYFIMGGHSAAAGHGNNFHQQYTMQFANIMEPIFHKLGTRLIARNLAMGGLGTIHYTMGASTLYGETDFLLWDSHMTERNPGDIDLFHKQALLGGERVPILFEGGPNSLGKETDGMLWYGERMIGESLMPLTTGLDQAETLPLATRYQSCEANVRDLCSDRNNPNKYHDSCWEPRSDYKPTTTPMAHVGGQASWHPGDRAHQFQSRKDILVFLDAFDHAFDVWEEGIGTKFPLEETHWHIGTQYKTIRDNLMEYINGEGKGKSACEQRVAGFFPGAEKTCRVSLSGMSEFTPINLGLEGNSITKHVKSALNGFHPRDTMVARPAYTGMDILPQKWKIPEDQVDLHAITIASTYAAPELDHSIVDEDDGDAEEAEDERRMLRRVARGEIDIEKKAKSSRKLDSGSVLSRIGSSERILSDKVIPGIGWGRGPGHRSTTGYCDGSPMSTCKRNPGFNCLLYAHNDNHGTLEGNGYSGWLIITIPKVKHGLIFTKLEWWWPRGGTSITKGWNEVNNGVDVEGIGNRALKAQPKDWPTDFKLDVAVNGKIVKTYEYEEFKPYTKEVQHNEAFYPLVNDETLVAGNEAEDVELGLRIRSESNPLDASFGITHIYYA